MYTIRLIISLMGIVLCQQVFAYDLTVAKDGSGNYTSVQAAVDAAPTGRTSAFTIFIKNAIYREKITIPSNKPFIKLVGESVTGTIITYSDFAGYLLSCTTTLGTQNSATFSVNANDFTALNLTIENGYGDGSQAVAVLVNADRAAFRNCRFHGNQDTLYLKGSGTPKVYFQYCYIDGNVDFIFGSAVAYFDKCVVYAKNRSAAGVSYITAPNTPQGQAYGFVFNQPLLPHHQGATSYFLSRPWPSPSEAATAQKVVILSGVMSGHIDPAGWTVWNSNTITGNLLNAEYRSTYYNGVSVDISRRAAWSSQLSDADTAYYQLANVLNGWNPLADIDFQNSYTATAMASNFKATKNAANVTLNWNMCWPMAGATNTVLKSTNGSAFATISTATSGDTAVNFSYVDANLPASGTQNRYVLEIARPGQANYYSDTLTISAMPNLEVNASRTLLLCGFTQTLGTPSVSQSFTIAGSNLVGGVTVQAPPSFEISADAGVTWTNSSNTLTLNPTGATLATTTILVRLNAAAIGTYDGNVDINSAQANLVQVPLFGRTLPPSFSEVLQVWPLVSNNSDDPARRNAGLQATIPTFQNLFLTDGNLPAPAGTIAPYSATHGQAFGANATGNNWQNVGGTLKRHYYQEFIVRPNPGSYIRIDSISFQSNFYGTNSGIKMSVVFSKNGFTAPADSTEFSDGIGPAGTGLTFTTSGNFSKAFALAQNNNGAVDNYSLALNNNGGVLVNEDEKIHIRIYWACSSTGTPRYGLLKDVKIIGVVTQLLPIRIQAFEAATDVSGSALLKWRVSAGAPGFHIALQRSLDAVHFETIQHYRSANSLDQVQQYIDQGSIQLGSAYYRLKCWTDEGEEQYSAIRFFKIAKSIKPIKLQYQAGQYYVLHPKSETGDLITIVNTLGQIMGKIIPANGSEQTLLPLGKSEGRLYLINWQRQRTQVTLKLLF